MRSLALLLLAVPLLAACQEPAASAVPPIYDSHVHLTPSPECVERALALFERMRVVKFCTKSAGIPGSRRFAATRALARNLGDRFAFFSNLDWRGVAEPGWPEREARRLEAAVRAGAAGVKIFKALGLGVREERGELLAVDDARLDPIMRKAAELGAVVAMHTGDPEVFFEPPGPRNERYFELLFAPSWSFYGAGFPSRKALLDARERLIARHPQTTFLGIHLANNPEDLGYVDRLLDAHPNLFVDVSARLGEIGRHPASEVRAFFVKHQDRILFGSDIIIRPDGYQLGSLSIWPDDDADADRFYLAHRRYFETGERGIDHPTPIQGYWTVDAIDLPPEVLRKLYVDNAERLIFSRKARKAD
ncbi:MAG: amidohydrolase family protein [Deltaproteobacteria bacterium]|nr:amidohydrolase family protein [Deltaproteobacteria bacterium]